MEAVEQSLATTAPPPPWRARHVWSRILPVPFVDLAAQQRALAGELQEAFRSALSRTDWILGRGRRAVRAGVRGVLRGADAVGVDSGLSALELALRA